MGKIIRLDGARPWRFHLGEAADAGFMGYDDGAWKRVKLPHDWAVEYPFDAKHASGTGYLPGGTGWYRCEFELNEADASKRVRLTFGGVYKHARVWINSHYLGNHAYGYTEFWFDVSPYVKAGRNVIAVRVEHEDVADSRWYTGSGIYREVWLEVCEESCFKKYGVFAHTVSVSNGTAGIRVEYATIGADGARFELSDADGKPVSFAEAHGESGAAALTVENPRLWSTETPYLYTLKCFALLNGEVTDETSLPFGVRTAVFDADRGFLLNGESLKIKGVCVHHDAGCLGTAVPREVWAQRLKTLKACGCNAIRTSHNPPDSNLLVLCDEMGFLVMDEAFDEWEGVKNKWWQGHNVYPPKHFGYAEDFPEWHERDLKSMVLRDRNHASVIMWSIGNEIDYPNDPYVTPLFKEVLGNNDANKPAAERLYDARKPDAKRLAAVAKELTDIVHSLDGTRLVTSALSFPELSNLTGYADALDASGYNYREQFYEADHKKYPGRVILGSENSHDPKCWYAVRDNEYMSAQFLWTGIDFLGECVGWPLRISQAGLLDLAGEPKPLYYQRKALWTDAPFIKIAAGKQADAARGAWGESFVWSGEDGEIRRVSCYTNRRAAELFLNGASLGVKYLSDEDGGRVCWDVAYAPGTLSAKAYGDWGKECAYDELSGPLKAEKLVIEADKSALPADGKSAATIKIRLADKAGRTAGSADESVKVQLLGGGEIIGLENGRPDDLTPYSERARETYRGKLTVYLRAGEYPDKLLLNAFVPGREELRAQCGIELY